jgi:hypothetical protein
MAKKEEVEEKEVEVEEEIEKQRYEVVEVPTQTAIMVRDNQDEKILQDSEVLTEILNKLTIIEKNTG